MNSKKMMLISLIATACLSVLAIVTIMIVTQFQNGDVQKAAESVKPKVAKPVEVESPEQEVAEFHSEGVRFYKDEYGTHDVYVEKETKDLQYNAVTGPIEITVDKLQMERLYAAEGFGLQFTEGKEMVTLVAATVTVKNVSNEDVYFELKTVRGKTDTGETANVEAILSDDFDLTYGPNDVKTGTIYYMFDSNPNKIATMTLKIPSAEDANSKPFDKGANLKVKLY